MRKIKEHTQRNPEIGYRFFVTDHPDTWTREEEFGNNYNKDWRVEVQKGYNNSMGIVPEGNGRGRLVTQHESNIHFGTQQATQPQPQPQHNPTSRERQRPRTIDSYGWTSYHRSRNPSHSQDADATRNHNHHTQGEDNHPYGSQ